MFRTVIDGTNDGLFGLDYEPPRSIECIARVHIRYRWREVVVRRYFHRECPAN